MKEEKFLRILEDYLSEELPSHEVRQHISYYRDYISTSCSVKSEEQVMQDLGDPRLIARTIIDQYKLTHKVNYSKSGRHSYQTRSEHNYHDGEVRSDKQSKKTKFGFGTVSLFSTLIGFLILILFLGVVFWVGGVLLKLFFRFIFPFVLILIGVNWIHRRFRR